MANTILVCAPAALGAAERERSRALLRELTASVVERVELPDGYAFRYAPGLSLVRVAEWIALERRCCSFFRFGLEVEGDGPVWLRLTGHAGVKEFLADAVA